MVRCNFHDLWPTFSMLFYLAVGSYGSHRGSFWSTEFDLKHSTFSIGKSRDQDHRHHTFSNRDYRNQNVDFVDFENLWLIKILCSDEVEICQAK